MVPVVHPRTKCRHPVGCKHTQAKHAMRTGRCTVAGCKCPEFTAPEKAPQPAEE